MRGQADTTDILRSRQCQGIVGRDGGRLFLNYSITFNDDLFDRACLVVESWLWYATLLQIAARSNSLVRAADGSTPQFNSVAISGNDLPWARKATIR
jgi:hypothetical protein